MQKGLERWAQNTKHRPHQYETPAQLEAIARKMLASHIRAVPWQNVYAMVSPGDLTRVQQRCRPYDMGSTKAPPAEFFKDLSKNISLDGTHVCFDHFREALNVENDGRALSLFLGVAMHADPHDLIEALYTESAEPNKKQLYNSIIAYPLAHEKDDLRQVAQDIGFVLRGLSFGDIRDGTIYLVEPLPASLVQEDTRTTDDFKKEPLEYASPQPKSWSTVDEASLRNNIAVDEWKDAHGLNRNFCSRKAAKQLLGMHFAPSHHKLLTPVLGKYQKAEDLSASFKGKAQDIRQAWNTLMEHGGADKMWKTKAIQSFVQKLEKVTPRSELEKLSKKDVIEKYMAAEKPFTPEMVEALVE